MLYLIIVNVLWIIFSILLIIQDLKYKKVNIISLLGFFLNCLLIFYLERKYCFLLPLIFLTIGVLYFFVKKKHAFGSADYIVIIASSFVISEDTCSRFLILCGLLGILTSLFYKSKKFPMIPSILISVLISRFFQNSINN
jgi:hypothetical protein